MNIPAKVKWFRTRNTFHWEGFTVALDYTKGYGHIIEIEQLATPDTKDSALKEIRGKLESLGVRPTPREVFEEKFKQYVEHWRELIQPNQS